MSMSNHARAGIERRSIGVLGTALAAAMFFSAGLAAYSWGMTLLIIVAAAAPFPFVILRIQANGTHVLLAAILAVTIVATLFSATSALAFVSLAAIPGFLLGESLARGRSLLRGSVWASGAMALQIGVVLLVGGSHVSTRMHDLIKVLRSPEILEQARSSGLSGERLDAVREQIGQLADAFALFYPGLLIILGVMLVLANTALVRVYLARRDPSWLSIGEFERLRWPLGLTVVFVAAVSCLAISAARILGANLLLILAFLFALQGLAITAFYVRRLASLWLRLALILLVVASPWSVPLLALLGLFDNWLDVRRWAEVPIEP
jgi:hypothetical protein